MKYLIALFMFFSVSALAQTNLRTVMTDTNGVVQRPTNFISTNRIVSVNTNGEVNNPTNFWTANSNSINNIVSQSSYLSDRIFNRQFVTFADLRTETTNGTATATNSYVALSVVATNSSGKAAIRLMDRVNSIAPAGVGTLFGSDSHFVWIRFDCALSESGSARIVLANSSAVATNIAEYPTNRAIGFEMRSGTNDTHELRLIAHNGTTNTNGPWVNIGSIFARHWIGVEQNKTNGEIRLYNSSGAVAPTLNTNATISGGPTNNAGGGESSFDVGIFATNTNAYNIGFSVYSAFVDVTD